MLIVRSVEDTEKMIREQLVRPIGAEDIPLPAAAGRVLAEDLTAREPVPAFTRSSVDGYAVRAQDTFGCGDAMPAMLKLAGEVLMGRLSDLTLQPGECAYVPTGGAIPAGADAMVMIEDTDDYGDEYRYVRKSSPPGAHLVFAGDDVRAGQLVLPAGTRLQPQHIGTLAALGQVRVTVARRPAVAILSIGNELAATGTPILRPGQVRDSNAPMLAAAVQAAGGLATIAPLLPDDAGMLATAIRQALAAADLVLISGGSSVGRQDEVAAVLDALGPPGILQHGLALKPGKPTIIAQIAGKPVFGLPGHPMAALFVCQLLVRPLILNLQGDSQTDPIRVPAILGTNIPSNQGRESIVPVRLEPEPDSCLPARPGDRGRPAIATPLFSKSGLIATLGQCQGYIRIPRECEGLTAGSPVEVCLFP